MNTIKSLLVGIICFVLGVGAVLAYMQYRAMKQQTATLQNQLTQKTISPTTSDKVTISPQPSGAVSPTSSKVKTATIKGTLGYPGEGIPPLVVYAFDVNDSTKNFYVETAQNQGTFTFDDLQPGTYTFVAYVKGNSTVRGGYSKAVPCGLSVDCTDHSLISVVLDPGEVNNEVAVKDWYAPDGTFPDQP